MLTLLLILPVALPGVGHELGHASVGWSDPAQGGKLVTAEVWYPADAAGEGVPLAAAPPSGFPVLSFGHGFLMPVERYAYLWEALVPSGYVMVLPTTNGGFAPDHLAFARDLAFAISRLEQEGGSPGSLFEGGIGARSAVMGHSMGGGASVLAAALDPTIEAVCNLAAAETNPSAIAAAAQVRQPALLLAGTADCVTPSGQHQGPIHAALAGSCALLATLEGATHCQFALPDFFCSLGELCSGSLSAATQRAMTLALVGPWLDATLKQDEGAWAQFLAAAGAPEVQSLAGACGSGPGPFRYCTAGTTASGCGAALSASGVASLSFAGGFVISGAGGEGAKDGLFFFAQNGRQANPWGNGTSYQCVVPPVTRTPLLAGGGAPGACDGLWALDFAAFAAANPLKVPALGAPAQLQLWFRDPAGTSNQTTSLSDALEFTLLP